ncbi:hypothetical protein HME9302_01872 [Alteripontixanthobacter maritimus]|uniref:Ice-binding protein C-terminal domain-containing protein n=1 Tax=Alteripontixanthobacter maritimus TaxID=2161824 RepID=A0A369QBP8_9SPHN|nr:PEP-CTERM sorting domain-containing protein [Alteripontixanthobacter maritimus]RDC60657.1 hypothetical protein HME9302_01872 [Alteripontixanthobacter maritimus]
MRYLALIALFPAAPAAAQVATVPEPSNLALFGLGVAGLIIGRYAAKRSGD